MDAHGFWIAALALVANVVIAGLGFYFGRQARKEPLRKLLYDRQVDLCLTILAHHATVSDAVLLAHEGPDSQRDRAWSAAVAGLDSLAPLIARASGILPEDLVLSVVNFAVIAQTVLEESRNPGRNRAELIARMVTAETDVTTAARLSLGIGPLSAETQALFAARPPLAIPTVRE